MAARWARGDAPPVVRAVDFGSSQMLPEPLPPLLGLSREAMEAVQAYAASAAAGEETPTQSSDAALGTALGNPQPWAGPGHVAPGSLGGLTRRVGTPVYQAPEVHGRDWGAAADIFSLGVTFYQVAAGRLPFFPSLRAAAKASPEQVARAVAEAPLEFHGHPWDSMSPGFVELLEVMLDRDPARRPTARQALFHPWLRQHSAFPTSWLLLEQPARGRGTAQAKRTITVAQAKGGAASPLEEQTVQGEQQQQQEGGGALKSRGRARSARKQRHPFHEWQLVWSWS